MKELIDKYTKDICSVAVTAAPKSSVQKILKQFSADIIKLQKKKQEKKTIDEEALRKFDEFWQAYPRKTNKKNAYMMWCRITMTDELFAKIMHTLTLQKNNWEDVHFIPHASTWLNGERWNDEVAPKIQADSKYSGI